MASAEDWLSALPVPVMARLRCLMCTLYLITWRVARRFGGRGLAVCVLTSAIIGPPRDYLLAATLPSIPASV
jgi:hypothetical protein